MHISPIEQPELAARPCGLLAFRQISKQQSQNQRGKKPRDTAYGVYLLLLMH
jgi:hypothetical protein